MIDLLTWQRQNPVHKVKCKFEWWHDNHVVKGWSGKPEEEQFTVACSSMQCQIYYLHCPHQKTIERMVIIIIISTISTWEHQKYAQPLWRFWGQASALTLLFCTALGSSKFTLHSTAAPTYNYSQVITECIQPLNEKHLRQGDKEEWGQININGFAPNWLVCLIKDTITQVCCNYPLFLTLKYSPALACEWT